MDIPFITKDMIIMFGLTLTVFILFIGEWLPVEGIGILILATLGISGILPRNEFLVGFSSDAPWMVASLFVVGAGFLHTGLVDSFGRTILRWSGNSLRRFLLIFMICVTAVSAFLNNTTVVAVFLPVAIIWARQLGIAPSRLLIPLSFCAILGGTCTLIGTSTNVVVSGFSDVFHFRPIGMFEITRMGILYAVAGIGFIYLFSIYFMPDRQPPLDETACPVVRRRYITEFQVRANSPLVGKDINAIPLTNSHDYRIFHIVRDEEVVQPPFEDYLIQADDLLLMEAPSDHIKLLQEKFGLSLHADHHLRPRNKGAEQLRIAEVMIPPGSPLVGKTLARLHFRLTHHVVVLAMQRRAKALDHGFSSVPLNSGDVLLLSGSLQAIRRLEDSRDVTLLSRGLEGHQIRHKKAWVVLLIMAAFVLCSSLTNMPIAVLSLLAAGAMVVCGCLSLEQAYQSIDWKIILFLGSAISLGASLERTGCADFLAYNAMDFFKQFGDRGVVAGIYIITVIITELITNNAAAALMLPFAYKMGVQMGIDPRPCIMAVLFGASASFATPIGYQTNMFIYGPGGYRFRDFLVIGIPLNILLSGVVISLIPYFWPLNTH